MVELKPGGVLELTSCDCSGADVSEVAIEYLFELARLGDGISMRDVFLSPLQLLDYPLRFDNCAEVWASGANYPSRSIDTADYGLPTLGQIFHSVLWELTFFGVGGDREAKWNGLAAMDESDFTEDSLGSGGFPPNGQ